MTFKTTLAMVCLMAAGPAHAQTYVPEDWALNPADLGKGDTFRLMVLTSTKMHATSSNIADYNEHVQAAVANGHAAIQAHSALFRAVGSTSSVDARDNTGTASGTGEPIYWLGGGRLADGYTDLWIGGWGTDVRNEHGTAIAASSSPLYIWTGSSRSGTAAVVSPWPQYLGAADVRVATYLTRNANTVVTLDTTISENARVLTNPLLGLSGAFHIGPKPVQPDGS